MSLEYFFMLKLVQLISGPEALWMLRYSPIGNFLLHHISTPPPKFMLPKRDQITNRLCSASSSVESFTLHVKSSLDMNLFY